MAVPRDWQAHREALGRVLRQRSDRSMSQADALRLLGNGADGIRAWNEWRGIKWVAGHPQTGGTPMIPSFEGVDLEGAQLRDAELYGADFSWANLRGADLEGSSLFQARLAYTDLRDASLRNCSFGGAQFHWTKLAGADVAESRLRGTTFNCDLSKVVGLDKLLYQGHTSILSTAAIKYFGEEVPIRLLIGCGHTDEEALQIKASAAGCSAYRSCFISYASQDEPFAHLLHGRLQKEGVPCWFAPQDLQIGAQTRVVLDDAVYGQERLVLVLSSASVKSQWVEKEAETALERERETGQPVLLPIRIDDSIFSVSRGWAADIRRTRHIGDFRRRGSYDESVSRLLLALRHDKSGAS
jgi:hypothetical protein